ncbi:MAG: ergothioneine biosynthesis protein EgtC [Actinomycetota bacterium]
MCRLLAYVGPPATLESLLFAPDHSLHRQAWAPRFQRHGTVNADGFGVGWYDLARRPEPAVYRSTRPMWGDPSFASLAGVVATTAALAAVRDATFPSVAEESATPPFADGTRLFAHNGAVDGFQGAAGGTLRRMLSDRRLGAIRGVTDSEVLFGLVLDRLDGGAEPAAALASVVRTVGSVTTGRINLVLHDGLRITATAHGDSLFVCEGGSLGAGTVVVASEPFDDHPAWAAAPEGSVVEAAVGSVQVRPPDPSGSRRTPASSVPVPDSRATDRTGGSA